MDNITANELAGLGVGALLLGATIAAPKVDAFISSSQRSSLGMCKRCGDLRLIACSRCKGSGSVNGLGPFNVMVSLLGESTRAAPGSRPCPNCVAKGHKPCPACSNLR